jgi:probable HAF family extracellular repeat protein
MSDLGTLGGTSASAASMNERGQIVGSSLTGSGHCHAFLWNNGSTADLGVLGGAYLSSHAVDINSSGQVVGNCSISDDDLDSLHDISRDSVSCRPFLYSNGAMVDINDLVDAPHGTFQLVRSIDDAGRITVYGSQMIDWGLYREYTYVLSPVPEPSTAVLSALGLFGFAGYALRRRG